MADAISTTNLQASYKNDGKPNRPRDEHREELHKELKQWKNRTIIRLLVYSQKDHKRDEKVAEILKGEPKTSNDELFFLCDKPYIRDLLGDTFARLAEAKTQNVEKLIETRANKRDFQTMEQEEILTDRKKQKRPERKAE